MWKASCSSVSLILLFLRAGSKTEAGCWSRWSLNQRLQHHLLTTEMKGQFKHCWSSKTACVTTNSLMTLFGSVTAVKPIELETTPKFCSAENANISLKWHSFVKRACAGKLMRVLIILERAREEWRTLKDFTMKLGVRGWISLNFERHQICRWDVN